MSFIIGWLLSLKLSSDPLFVEKVRDTVVLYLSPPTHALVLCIDERSQIQALDREQPVLPMMPRMPERRTHNYVRQCYKRHRATEFLDSLKEIDANVPDGLDVHIVMDNYATHKTRKIEAWLARRPHHDVHFTPTSASWINQVERWFAELTREQIQRGVHTSVVQLERGYPQLHRSAPRQPKALPMDKSGDEILAAVKRFCQKADRTLCSEP